MPLSDKPLLQFLENNFYNLLYNAAEEYLVDTISTLNLHAYSSELENVDDFIIESIIIDTVSNISSKKDNPEVVSCVVAMECALTIEETVQRDRLTDGVYQMLFLSSEIDFLNTDLNIKHINI